MVQATVQTTVTGLQGRPIATTPVPAGNQALVWNGTAWAPAGPYLTLSGGTLTGPLVLQGNATAQLNPVPLQQLQAGYLPLAGGTISGNLSVTGTVTQSALVVNGAATINSNATITGTVFASPGGRIVSQNAGNNPAVTVYSTAAPASAFCIFNQIQNLQFGIADGNGNPTQALGRFDPSGNLIITGTLSQGSDETTKNTIAAYAPGVSVVSQLLPKTFIYNSDTTNTQHLGFIAQDVQPVLGDAVASSPGFDGAAATLILDPTAILAATVNAVKQLISRVAALESHDGITPTAAQTA